MPNSITKKVIAARVASKIDIDLTSQELYRIVQETIEVLSDSLINGERIVLRNFGTFSVKEVKPKVGRNPKDPEREVIIPARKTVKFRAGKELKEQVAK